MFARSLINVIFKDLTSQFSVPFFPFTDVSLRRVSAAPRQLITFIRPLMLQVASALSPGIRRAAADPISGCDRPAGIASRERGREMLLMKYYYIKRRIIHAINQM